MAAQLFAMRSTVFVRPVRSLFARIALPLCTPGQRNFQLFSVRSITMAAGQTGLVAPHGGKGLVCRLLEGNELANEIKRAGTLLCRLALNLSIV